MKKITALPIIALLLAIGVLGLSSCSKKSNPFAPNALNGNAAVAKNLPFVNGGTPQGSIETDLDIVVQFDQLMQEDLLELPANVTVRDVTNHAAISNLTLTYEKETQRLTVHRTSAWPTNAALLVTIKSTVTSLTGQALDGNVNQRADGTPYDDARRTFYTGTGWADWSAIRTEAPKVSSTVPPVSGQLGSVWIYQTITIYFDQPMETATLGPENFVLVDGMSGTPVELEQFPLLSGIPAYAVSSNWVTFRRKSVGLPLVSPPLSNGTIYRFTIKPEVVKGAVNLTDNAASPLRDLDLEANERGSFSFLTDAAAAADATPPQVLSVSHVYTGEARGEVVVRFSEAMDVETLSLLNIRVSNSNGTVIHGPITADVDKRGFRFTIGNVENDWYTLKISRKVTDVAGWELDSNSNGLGGEVEDDYSRVFNFFDGP